MSKGKTIFTSCVWSCQRVGVSLLNDDQMINEAECPYCGYPAVEWFVISDLSQLKKDLKSIVEALEKKPHV